VSCAAFAFALACARQQSLVAEQPVTLGTIDSAWTWMTWDSEGGGMWLYRVAVGRGGRVDTIANIIEPLPFVVDSERVAGLQYVPKDTGQSRAIFIYSASNRKIRSWPVPDDVWGGYFDVMISPDARYVAYVDAKGWYPVVREIATNRVVLRDTTEGGGCECDVDRNHARWINADSVEILVAHDVKPPEGWFLMAGRPSTKAVHVKMLDEKPDWPGH
jgi:hypothetical protein